MRILHVTNHFSPCIGGIESHVEGLCNGLSGMGHISDVLCLNRCPDGRELPAEWSRGKARVFAVPFIDFKYYKVSRGILERLSGYDVIHVHGLGYFFDFVTALKTVHKKPVVLSTHGGFFHTKSLGKVKNVIFNTITRLNVRNADAVIAVSEQDMETFSRISKKVKYVPNFIDCSSFRPGRKRKGSFVYVGRISRNKRLDNMIKTFCLVSDSVPGLSLRIAGGDFDGSLQSLSPPRDCNVEFVGTVSESGKRKILGESEFFMSSSEYEGFGINVLEAMASGCVPIVNDIRAFRNIVPRKLTVDYSCPEEASRRILGIMDMDVKPLRERMLSDSKKYDQKTILKTWEEIYKGLL